MRTGWRGVGFELEGPGHLLEEVVGHLPPFFDQDQPAMASARVFEEDGSFALEVDGERPSRFVPTYPTLLDVATVLEVLLVERLPDLVAVHAGAIALDRQAILLPGRPQTGKTRLIMAWLREGARYLSDEFALLDDQGRVHPYPRLLAMREGSQIRRVPPESLGSAAVDTSCAVSSVAVLTYDEQTADLDAAHLSSSDIWLRLMEHCISVHARPEPSFATLTTVAAAARGVEGRRGEATEALPKLRDLLSVMS